MAAGTSASPADPEEPALASQTSDHRITAFAELKDLCEKNQLYWPASEIEGYSAKGHNDEDSLRYAV